MIVNTHQGRIHLDNLLYTFSLWLVICFQFFLSYINAPAGCVPASMGVQGHPWSVQQPPSLIFSVTTIMLNILVLITCICVSSCNHPFPFPYLRLPSMRLCHPLAIVVRPFVFKSTESNCNLRKCFHSCEAFEKGGSLWHYWCQRPSEPPAGLGPPSSRKLSSFNLQKMFLYLLIVPDLTFHRFM